MSAPELVIPTEGWPPPWPLLLEVAEFTNRAAWTVVGGMMVQIHAELAGIPAIRTTVDVDLLLHLMTRNVTVGTVVGSLQRIGFTPQEPGWPAAPFHRLRRGDDIVDVLVPDHLPTHVRPRVLRRPVMPIDGGAQALDRLMEVDLVHGSTRLTVTVPDLLGALVLKAAAAGADSRDRARHERDAAFLASLITDHATQRDRLHGSDRKRLSALVARLADPYHPAWVFLPGNLAQRGQDTLRILTN